MEQKKPKELFKMITVEYLKEIIKLDCSTGGIIEIPTSPSYIHAFLNYKIGNFNFPCLDIDTILSIPTEILELLGGDIWQRYTSHFHSNSKLKLKGLSHK